MDKYIKQAKDFLTKTETIFAVKFLRNDYHWDSDTTKRDIYEITFTRGNRSMVVVFGQSIANSMYYHDKVSNAHYAEGKEYYHQVNGSMTKRAFKDKFFSFICPMSVPRQNESYMRKAKILIDGKPPTEYDVLACLTKYDPGTFEDFCSEFGYETDSIKATKIYQSVKSEALDVERMWSDLEIELLQEIQ